MNSAALIVISAVLAIGGITLSTIALVLGAAGSDLVSEEVRTRLDRLPVGLLRMVVRLLPGGKRERYMAEAMAVLHEILRETDGLPITRLWRGVRYAAGWVWAASAIRWDERSANGSVPIVAAPIANEATIIEVQLFGNGRAIALLSDGSARVVYLSPTTGDEVLTGPIQPVIVTMRMPPGVDP